MDIITIAAYTGGVFVLLLIIFCIVMCIEKIRKSRKSLTEIVELKPIDLEEHYRGVHEREAQRRIQAERER